jgi:hypothetical protein
MARSKASRFAIGALAILASAQFVQSAETPSIPAGELVRLTVQNEIRASEDPGVRHMFFARKETNRGSQTKLYCETRDAMAGMAIANDDKPLSPQQRQAEEARLEQLINNPFELARKRQKEKEDTERVTRIVRAMPDAFFFEYDGTMPGQSGLGKDGSELIRLKFRPNPKYDPPTHVEQVLQAMQGLMLIDARTHRIARIDGTLFREIGFGWGILGHLDKGGHFLVEQTDVGDGSWDMTRMSLAFTGKIMLFKKLDIKSTEVYTDFRPVPSNTTFAQGVDLLKKQEATLAQNRRLETNPK